MSKDWRHRLKRLIDETPGLTMKSVSLRAGMSASGVHDILKRGATPSVDTIVAIARAIGVKPSALLDGAVDDPLTIPVVGIVSAGEGWTPVDDGALTSIEFALGAHDTIAVEVRGDSMAPVYRNGDILICHRRYGPHADNLTGLDCVVRTMKGENFVKILKRGSRPGRFNLKSYNPVVDDVEDVALAWVAPVAWIKRRDA